MRNLFCHCILLGIAASLKAQSTDSAASALSPWQRVQIQRSAVALSTASRVSVIEEDFTTSQHHWPTGEINDFDYKIVKGGYTIRRTGKRDGKSGRTFITLPDSLNLNQASTFIIEVDMVVPKGTVPEGGLLVGARDKANYMLFALTGPADFMVKRVVEGNAGPAYRSGKFVSIAETDSSEVTSHTLRVAGHDGQLFFAIDGQETPGDAIAFRKLPGNGIGFISAADTTTFQNLRITVGMP